MFMIIIILGLFVEIFTSAVSACPFPETYPTARAKKHHGASTKEAGLAHPASLGKLHPATLGLGFSPL